jgi:RNA polymerase sigma-70 factor, ECF subfamily
MGCVIRFTSPAAGAFMPDAPQRARDRHFTDPQSGSQAEIATVLDSYRPYLMKIARKELPAAMSAKGGASDLVQETFLEAIRDLGHFHGNSDAELRAWLRCLLLHHVTKLHRCYRASRKRQLDREIRLADEDDGTPAAVPSHYTSPTGRAVANEQIEVLNRVIQRLPDDYRTVIRLRYVDKKSFDEIAGAMDRSVNAVTLLWFRAVQRMRQHIGAES